MPQSAAGTIDGPAIIGNDRASEAVRRRLINFIENRVEVSVAVDVDAEDGPEVFRAKDVVPRILGDDQGRSDVPPFAVVGLTTGDDRRICGTTGSGDRLSVLGEGTLVDHRGREVGKISDVTNAQIFGGLDQLITHRVPDAARNVGPGRGGTFLPGVLERPTDQRRTHHIRIRAGMSDHEVFAAGLSNEPGIGAIAGDVGADALPQMLKGLRRTGEVDAGKITMTQRDL